ncbi:MAG: cytochrome C oxidase subunit IV family protein [Acidobacteriota bacterium]|nr:cytochrome C oxidase subunit IV family protein [Acidobacteriota bacterium]
MPEQVAEGVLVGRLEHGSHIESKKLYIAIWIILLCFTALTTGVAFIDLGPLNTIVALAIAVIKAGLVVLFFMHARHSEKLVRVVIGVAIFWLLILIVITIADFSTRNLIPVSPWLKNQPIVVHHLTPGP